MKYRIESWFRDGGRIRMRIRHIPTWLERFFFAKEKTIEYLGSCTVWYELPSYSIVCGWHGVDCALHSFWAAIEDGNLLSLERGLEEA